MKDKNEEPIEDKALEELAEEVQSFYKDWCKKTKRNGGVLIGSSIRELLNDFAGYKANQSDAIEFYNWCESGRAWFFDNNEEHTHTTEELYQIFKNKP